MKDGQISGYFDTKYMTVLRIEQILQNFEDQKFTNFLDLEQVNFSVTFVTLILPCKSYYRPLFFVKNPYTDISKVHMEYLPLTTCHPALHTT